MSPESLFRGASREVPEGWDWARLFHGMRRIAVPGGDPAWPAFEVADGELIFTDALFRFMRAFRREGDFWEPLEKPFRGAVVVLAVRAGIPGLMEAPDEWFYDPEDPTDAAAHLVGDPPGWVRRLKPTLWGPEIIDLIALPLSLRGTPLRYSGLVRYLGDQGFDVGTEPGDAPVRVHAALPSWLASGCDGVVLLGSAAEQQQVLRGFRSGLVADSVAHGEQLRWLMRRDLPAPPEIYVRQAEAV